MDRPEIQLLSPDVAAQIAAGEVVERPASVVKELVENAIDAQSTRIHVSIVGGGKRGITVIDDGWGMSEHEARLALLRHATSKIRALADLDSLMTLGFRGEGLFTIAAVAELALTTGQSPGAGIRLTSRGGTHIQAEPVGCSRGTRVDVRDLFFNTPARQKFLKSTATEAAHITEVVQHLACAHPHIHFTLVHDQRTIFSLPATSHLAERVQAIVERRGARFFPIDEINDELGIAAVLSSPDSCSQSARSLWLLINRRPVRDRALIQAVVAGFGARLPAGRFPLGILRLEISPHDVDVNVHPQKREVRFARPEWVCQQIHDAVAKAVEQEPWTLAQADAVYRVDSRAARREIPLTRQRAAAAVEQFWSARESSPEYRHESPSDKKTASSIRWLGSHDDEFMVGVTENEFIVVDRWAMIAAYHRRRLNALLESANEIPGDELSSPQAFDAGSENSVLSARHVELAQLGFHLEPFGGTVWNMRAIPRGIALTVAASVALAIVSHTDKTVSPANFLRHGIGIIADHLASEQRGNDETFASLIASSEVWEQGIVAMDLVPARSTRGTNAWGMRIDCATLRSFRAKAASNSQRLKLIAK